jgi:hypothetical protein
VGRLQPRRDKPAHRAKSRARIARARNGIIEFVISWSGDCTEDLFSVFALGQITKSCSAPAGIVEI